MRQYLTRFVATACIHGLYIAFTERLFLFPSEIITFSIMMPPILGLVWGLPAALGVSAAAVIAVPYFHPDMTVQNSVCLAIYLFLASYLPYFLWHKWQDKSRSAIFTTKTLGRLIAIFFCTFIVTTLFRVLTVTDIDLDSVAGLFDSEKNNAIFVFAFVCFVNDFFTALFFDLVIFFMLVVTGFKFHRAENFFISEEEELTTEEKTVFYVLAACYLVLPMAWIFWDVYQIYGMNRLETWIKFTTECITLMDVYIVFMIYMLLKYRRSIMLEIVFLVALTVFLSAAVLGFGSSITMFQMAEQHADDSLNAMSVICRERLDRTFFCVRQAVNGMARQAVGSIESYQRFVEDPIYRRDYLLRISDDLDAIAMDTDGCISYYFRLEPAIDGYKGGFSKTRASAHWEGALSPFLRRDPMDLSPSANDSFDRSWYYTPLKSKHATWIEPYIDPGAKSYVISYVAPIFVDGKFIGVIGMDIDFNFIIQELRRMSIYDYGYVYIMNRNNTILYHKDQEQGTQFKPNPEFQEIERYLTNGMWLGIATPLSKVHDNRNNILMHLIAAILIVAIFVSFGSIVLVSRTISPLSGMTEAAKRIASGDLNVTISYESGNELGLLVQSIREMANKLEFYIYRDKLTGVRNSAAYIGKSADLNRQAESIPDKLSYAVVLFDVNFLKKINDNLGHQAGDQLIRSASKVMTEVFLNSKIYRIGGDEFVAVLEGEDYENREKLIQLFDEKIAEETFEFGGEAIHISVARGMAIYEQGMQFTEVSKKADVEMYKHKKAIKAKFGEDVR